MRKTGLWLGYIFTFGILYAVLRAKAKKAASTTNAQLTVSAKIPFAPSELAAALGGADNIASTAATISSFKASLKDRAKADEAALRRLRPKGLMWDGSGAVTLLFGDFSGELKSRIDALREAAAR